MLLGFKVKNFKSFKELQHFSLIAGKVRSNESHIIEKNNKKILKFSGIYGANGSGKSNLIVAMDFIHDLLDFGSNFLIDKLYFRGKDILTNEPSYFEYELLINDKFYSYGFEIVIKDRKIISEWLIDMTSREKIIYDRNITEGNFKKSNELKKGSALNCLEEMKNNSSVLFLSELIRRSRMSNLRDEYIDEIYKIYEFFRNDFIVITPDTHKLFGFDFLDDSDEKIKILNQLDINIEKFEMAEEDLKNIKNLLPDNIFSNLMNDLNSLKSENPNKNLTIRVGNNVYVANVDEKKELVVKSLTFRHKNCEDIFGTYEESDGTIRIIELLDVIFSKNKVYVIDELDNSLHPILVNGFLSRFLNSENNNQLIVTTHESRTLDFDLVRRDEIWFTEKDENCSSRLYSLEEFKDIARFDKRIDKAYMEGRFGGIANISKNYEN